MPKLEACFRRGLRSSSDAQRGSEELIQCTNMRVDKDGLIAPVSLANTAGMAAGMAAASPAIVPSWPYPQFFTFKSRMVCATASEVYYVTFTAPDTWVFTNVRVSPGLEWSYIIDQNIVVDEDFEAIAASWSYTPGEFTQYAGGGAVHGATASPCTIQHTGMSIAVGSYTVVIEGVATTGSTGSVTGTVGATGTAHTPAVGSFTYTDTISVGASSSVGVTVGAAFVGRITRLRIYPVATSINGGNWFAADFGEMQMLFSNATDTLILTTNKVYIDNDTVARTGCNFRGQLVLGNFGTTPLKQELIDYWTARGGTPAQLGSNTVWWSSVGLADRMMMFDPDSVMQYETMLEDIMKARMQGWDTMPWLGGVYVIKPLQSCVLVYGTNGIAKLIPNASLQFGVQALLDVGVASRLAVGGDVHEHVFVSADGELWKIADGDPISIKKLEYSEWINGIKTQVAVDYDPINMEYYIRNASTYSYLLTRYGLSKVLNNIGSVFANNGTVYSVATAGATGVVIETDEMDFGDRNIKSISDIKVGMKSTTGTVNLTLKSTFKQGTAFRSTQPALVLPDGRVNLSASGVSFKFLIETSSAANLSRLEYILFELNANGKRRLHSITLGA